MLIDMKNGHLFLCAALLLLGSLCATPSFCCTSIVASGKATPDGRPLLWKNRETSAKENLVKHYPAAGGLFSFVGIVNAGKSNPYDIWIGVNSTGFSIMNTQSYNITAAEDKDKDDENGAIMRQALERCTTVDDFAHYLDTLARPILASANFGVIDARGGAAYFEVNRTQYFRYDAADAPDGYLVRSNYSFAGRPVSEGHGHIRYAEADRCVREALATDSLTPDFILGEMARSYANPLLGFDLRRKGWDSDWAVEEDIITRWSTTCSVVVQGVRTGENPALSTMWTIVGYPGTTVAMPVWECAGQQGIPSLLQADANNQSELSHWGYLLKKKVYSYSAEDSRAKKYFNWKRLKGYLDVLLPFEHQLLAPYKAALSRWRIAGSPDREEIARLNSEKEKEVREVYKEKLLTL